MPNLKERRAGALLGAAVGDSLGVTHEFKSAEEIPSGRFEMVGGGPFQFAPGAPSDDTDLLYVTLQAYPMRNAFVPPLAVHGMLGWLAGDPSDVGMQTRTSLDCWKRGGPPPTDEEGQGNGGLMRAAAHALACDNSQQAADFAKTDTLLTHPSSTAAEVSAFYVSILCEVLNGTPATSAISNAASGAAPWAAYSAPESSMGGWCVHSLRLALWALESAESYESGIDAVIRSGGDTDTNACIAGALLGARFGIQGIPADWIACLQDNNRDRLMAEVERLF